MGVKVFDGLDHYGSQADMQARAQNNALMWSDIPAGAITFVPGRGGYGYAASLNSPFGFLVGAGCSFNENYTAAFPCIATMAIPGNAAPTNFIDYMIMDYTAQNAQATFRCLLDSGSIVAYSGDPELPGSAVIGTSPPNAFSPFIWNKIEISVVIGASGSFDFHVNGNSALSASGVAVQAPTAQVASPNNFFNGYKVRFQGINAVLLDDFNLNDTTTGPGTYPCNGFLGDVATRTLRTAANSSVQWTPLTGANWLEVNEAQFDGDASYNYATAGGDKDLYSFGALPSTVSAVFAVQITGAYRKLDAGAQTITQNLVSGGTATTGAIWPMSLNYSYATDLFVVDPHTGATWAPSAVNAAIAGPTLNS